MISHRRAVNSCERIPLYQSSCFFKWEDGQKREIALCLNLPELLIEYFSIRFVLARMHRVLIYLSGVGSDNGLSLTNPHD